MIIKWNYKVDLSVILIVFIGHTNKQSLNSAVQVYFNLIPKGFELYLARWLIPLIFLSAGYIWPFRTEDCAVLFFTPDDSVYYAL